MINIIQHPKKDGDEYLIQFSDLPIKSEYVLDSFRKLVETDEYFRFKFERFNNKDISKDGVEKFSNRPSYRDVVKISNLAGSIYTYTMEARNEKEKYENIIDEIKATLQQKPDSRRMIVRFTPPIQDSLDSETQFQFGSDITCLSFIHYLKDKVRIAFRANDVHFEMFYDFILIYFYFIKPVYEDLEFLSQVSMYASTSQNAEFFSQSLGRLQAFFYESKEQGAPLNAI